MSEDPQTGDNITTELKHTAKVVFVMYCVAASLALIAIVITLLMNSENFKATYMCKNCLACCNCPLLLSMMIYFPVKINKDAVDDCVGLSTDLSQGLHVLVDEQQKMQNVYIGMIISYVLFFCCICCSVHCCFVGKQMINLRKKTGIGAPQ